MYFFVRIFLVAVGGNSMDYVILAVSNLTSALFLFYMLQMIFGERLSAKGVLIVYNIIMIASGVGYYGATSDWIGAIVSVVPYLLIQGIVFNFKNLFNFNLRNKQFKKRMKKENTIYSQQKSKTLISYIFMGFAISLLIVMGTLYMTQNSSEFKQLSLMGMILAGLLMIATILVRFLGKKQIVDLVILTIGTKNPKMYAFEIVNLNIKEKKFLTDSRYIVDYVGKIHISRKDNNQMTHHYLITNDQVHYESDLFSNYDNDALVEVIGNFERYSLKKIDVVEENGAYRIVKETNL